MTKGKRVAGKGTYLPAQEAGKVRNSVLDAIPAEDAAASIASQKSALFAQVGLHPDGAKKSATAWIFGRMVDALAETVRFRGEHRFTLSYEEWSTLARAHFRKPKITAATVKKDFTSQFVDAHGGVTTGEITPTIEVLTPGKRGKADQPGQAGMKVDFSVGTRRVGVVAPPTRGALPIEMELVRARDISARIDRISRELPGILADIAFVFGGEAADKLRSVIKKITGRSVPLLVLVISIWIVVAAAATAAVIAVRGVFFKPPATHSAPSAPSAPSQTDASAQAQGSSASSSSGREPQEGTPVSTRDLGTIRAHLPLRELVAISPSFMPKIEALLRPDSTESLKHVSLFITPDGAVDGVVRVIRVRVEGIGTDELRGDRVKFDFDVTREGVYEANVDVLTTDGRVVEKYRAAIDVPLQSDDPPQLPADVPSFNAGMITPQSMSMFTTSTEPVLRAMQLSRQGAFDNEVSISLSPSEKYRLPDTEYGMYVETFPPFESRGMLTGKTYRLTNAGNYRVTVDVKRNGIIVERVTGAVPNLPQ